MIFTVKLNLDSKHIARLYNIPEARVKILLADLVQKPDSLQSEVTTGEYIHQHLLTDGDLS